MKHLYPALPNTFFKKITFVLFLLACCAQHSFGQAAVGMITGKIRDKQTGDFLVGATIVIKGTSIGANTDIEGAFRVTNVPVGSHTLVISYLGFTNQEVPVTVQGPTILPDVQLETNNAALGEVLITGLRRSQLQSISQKREGLGIKEVITASESGRLPDINVAEATQRVSGVSIETNRGEGQFVSIRGIQPSLNNVTLNNTTLASTTDSRATALDLMPTEVISSIEIIKTTTPDMEGNAIGGTVNINTLSAFSKDKPFVTAALDGIYQPQQVDLSNFDKTKMPFRAAVTAGQRFGKKQNFGAVVSANFFRRDFSASMLDPDGWEWNKYFYPNEIELQIEDIERDRLGLSADFEFRPTDKNSIYFKTLYTHTNEIQKNSEFELTMQIGDALPLEQTPYTGRFARGSGELDQAYTDQKENLYSYTLGTRNRFGRLSTNVYGTFSRAFTSLNNFDATFENPKSTEPQLSLKYNTQPFFFEILPENPELASNPEIYKLRNLNFTDGIITENVYEVSADLTYDFKLGATPGYIKFGGRHRDRSKSVDQSRDAYDLSFGDVTAENPYSLTPFLLPTFEPTQGGASPFVHGIVNKFRDFARNPVNLQDPTRLVYDPVVSETESYTNDLKNSETVTAGYVMGVLNFENLAFIAGARVERTRTESNNAVVTLDDDAEELTVGNSRLVNTYTNFLPSVQLKFNVTEDFLMRASWTNTLGRPNYAELSGTTNLSFAETSDAGLYEGSLEIANPNLKPYISRNLDISLEHYFPKGGIIAVGGFYKNILNQIYTVENEYNDTLYAGKQYAELETVQVRNADAAKLYGIEFSYDQAFTFLPKALNGLGFSANFALIGSKVNLPNRPGEDLPLFRQAKNVYNLALYYQKKGFEFRAASSHRSAFLTEAASVSSYEDAIEAGIAVKEFDRYDAARTTYDLSGSYQFYKKRLKITAQLRNLTNEPEQGYQGNTSRYDRHDLTGRSFFLGASFNW
ncbi:TonB-dependent receptor [Adhaeribacter pallidiroseus]|uniref:TonB-dependent receptor n=1 Tax=Adhaeribacter pallidiroseus TaxID=2072847 RepID=A0A369QE44_9BACT|nr:TonB-dependent receptor [Adhaeribacter pallidiroseus]RDC61835.1 hypothetical protein AHMF7616_00424 [Adhaeribacter pallidiroseus]